MPANNLVVEYNSWSPKHLCWFVITACRNLSIVDAIMHKLDRYAGDLEHIIDERTRELQAERKKSELLLYSMMPP